MNQPVKSYRDLEAWQKGMELAELVYSVTRAWPKDELYGLTAQVRRAAVSVPSNISEGYGRLSTKEYLHHVGFARGSVLEVETQVMLAHRLGYATAETEARLLSVTAQSGKLINGLCRYLISKIDSEAAATTAPRRQS